MLRELIEELEAVKKEIADAQAKLERLMQAAKAELDRQEGNGKAEEDAVELAVRVLGVMPGKKEGVVKALVQDGNGKKFELYANGKGGAAQKISKAIGETVKVKAKKLNCGWFAIQVA